MIKLIQWSKAEIMSTKEVQSLIVILNFLQNNRATSNRTACCGQFSKRSDLQHTSGVVTVWALVWVYLTVWRWCVCLYALVAVFADLVECARICQITHSSTRPTANIPRVGFPGNNTTTCWSDLRYHTAVQKHKYTEDESAWETEVVRGGGTALNPTEHLGSRPKSQHSPNSSF